MDKGVWFGLVAAWGLGFGCGDAEGAGAADVLDTGDGVEAVGPGDVAEVVDPAGELRFDQIQALGTHNSYHLRPPALSHPSHDYAHPPLAEQLEGGVRHFELDVHRAPDGTGVRVHHITTIDQESSCPRLADCLEQLRAWSLANPWHHLVVVIVEPVDDLARLFAESGADPKESGEDLWEGYIRSLDEEIRAVFPDRLLTPERFRDGDTSIRERLEDRGFVRIADTRGQVAFVLNDTGALRAEYRAGGEGAMFVFGEVGEDDAAFVKADNPVTNAARIEAAVKAGYVVRTRADADLEVDAAVRDLALASGAQLVSTDFPALAPAEGYAVWLPGGAPSRCNPVSAPAGCEASRIESGPR